MKKLFVPILLLIVIALATVYLVDRLTYPVTYKVCGVGYQDCHPVAKFKDRHSCETTNQKWGWYCDQKDKSNIICQEKESDISSGYCD